MGAAMPAVRPTANETIMSVYSSSKGLSDHVTK